MDLAIIDETSQTFLGQWKRLVSTTNWDKGRIICQWRSALVDAEAALAEYSDDAWSRRVGNVTPQHVGRLRRVYDRFGSVHETYDGLYWSHFQTALDWDDAELWLEGAVQNAWSISQMRKMRWEAMGAPDGLQPDDSEIVAAELDEDAEPLPFADGNGIAGPALAAVKPTADQAADDVYEDSDEDAPFAANTSQTAADDEPTVAMPAATELRRPFAELPSLPADVTDAFEAFKLCILRHRLAGWQEVSREDLCATLDALKELVNAAAE